MEKSAQIRVENVRTIEGCSAKLRPFRSSNRNDGKGRYDLRPFPPSIKQPRRHLNRQNVTINLVEYTNPKVRRRVVPRPRVPGQVDEVTLPLTAVVPPSVLDTATVPPINALQPLGGGDGNGGDALTTLIGQRGISPETDDQRDDVMSMTSGKASAPNSPGAHNQPEAIGEGGYLTDDQCSDGYHTCEER